MHFKASTFMVSYLHQFSAVMQKMLFGAIRDKLHFMWCKVSIMTNYTRYAHSKGAIWDKFREQHLHQSIQK